MKGSGLPEGSITTTIQKTGELRLIWHGMDCPMDFRSLPLDSAVLKDGGVYVIHRRGSAWRVGQAKRLRDRLRAHQRDPQIVGVTDDELAVAWAVVPRAYRSGVETFLGRVLRPDVAERFPDAKAITVNLPNTLDLPREERPIEANWSLCTREAAVNDPSRCITMDLMSNDAIQSGAKQRRQPGVPRDDLVSLVEAVREIRYWHGKDAKNSEQHRHDECGVCAALGRIEPIIAE